MVSEPDSEPLNNQSQVSLHRRSYQQLWQLWVLESKYAEFPAIMFRLKWKIVNEGFLKWRYQSQMVNDGNDGKSQSQMVFRNLLVYNGKSYEQMDDLGVPPWLRKPSNILCIISAVRLLGHGSQQHHPVPAWRLRQWESRKKPWKAVIKNGGLTLTMKVEALSYTYIYILWHVWYSMIDLFLDWVSNNSGFIEPQWTKS